MAMPARDEATLDRRAPRGILVPIGAVRGELSRVLDDNADTTFATTVPRPC
jgi:hypothetical protein